MNAASDNAARKGLRGWWTSPLRPGMQRMINPGECRHLDVFWGHAYRRWLCRGHGRCRLPFVCRLRMGSHPTAAHLAMTSGGQFLGKTAASK
jgi:hypothetical protein